MECGIADSKRTKEKCIIFLEAAEGQINIPVNYLNRAVETEQIALSVIDVLLQLHE
jgi:hypothetical protein